MHSSALPPFELSLQKTLRDHWRDRIARHFRDTYAGLPFLKFPEDLRVYEHLLWMARPQTVIEVGVHQGASVLWFRDRLEALTQYGGIQDIKVVGVDVDITEATRNLDRVHPLWRRHITLLEGDITDPATVAAVCALLPAKARAMLIEDSAHDYAATLASLRGLSHLVPVDGFIVVEDTCVDIDELRCAEDWPRGAAHAVRDWLTSTEGGRFTQRRDLEQYILTCHPGGFLQRVSPLESL